MSPNRRITNYRSCLTETVYDPGRKTFAEAAVPHPFLARPSNSKMSLARSTTGCAPAIRAALARTRSRVRDAHATHLGYPYNLLGRSELPADIWRYLINNLGDPYAGSHFGSEVCDLERDAVAWLMDLWDCDRAEDFWGSVGASGTEGNLWALYLAREALPDARLLYGAEAHYSIPKAARILRIDAAPVACSPDGAIGLDALSAALSEGAGRPVILALTCGTTVKGAHDDIAEAVACLDAAGVDPTRRFIHVDGALNAMVIPFIDDAPSAIRPSFRHGVDSISTSGHKMIGTPMPCGVLVARRGHVDRVASSIAYLRSNDTTLMGSRSGHAVLAIWSRLLGHGAAGFRADVHQCLDRAGRMAERLRSAGIPVLRNACSLTVLFPEPSEEIVKTYQLACHRGEAHAVIMPNVTDALIDRFLDEYVMWWRTAGAAAVRKVSGPRRKRLRIGDAMPSVPPVQAASRLMPGTADMPLRSR